MADKEKIKKRFFVFDKNGVQEKPSYQYANQTSLEKVNSGEQDILTVISYGEIPPWLNEMLKTSKGKS